MIIWPSPFANEVVIEAYCDAIRSTGVRWRSISDLRRWPFRLSTGPVSTWSSSTRPRLPSTHLDWFYGAAFLRKGGVVVFDDVQPNQVRLLIDAFIEPDPRWERLAGTDKWSAFRRLTEGSLSEGEWDQPFFPSPPVPIRDRMSAATPLWIKRRLYALGVR